ncbi:transcription-repair coupling factor [Furfurilactobacillus curtus]|uniref:Transcription-repair-coupling factor n=1 Tax=Furfurilactobacillus curtus TaxID=1746200 RepID=A0ABQ5JP93_9LACO
MELQDFMRSAPEYQQILAGTNKRRQLVTGMAGSARSLLLSTLLADLKQPLLMVTDTAFHAGQLADDLTNVLPDEQVFNFPAEEMLATEIAVSSPEARADRVRALHALQRQAPIVVISDLAGLRRYLPQPSDFAAASFTLVTGQDYQLRDLQNQLHQMGYVHEQLVARPGDFAVRGSIFDIYPLDADYPVRVDFFDTQIDSLRTFDPENQRSLETIEQITVLPATELVMNPTQLSSGKAKLSQLVDKYANTLSGDERQQLTAHFDELLVDDAQPSTVPELGLYAHLFYQEPAGLLDYLTTDGVVLFDDYNRLIETDRQISTDEANWITDRLRTQSMLPEQPLGHDFRQTIREIKQVQVFFSLFQKGMGNMRFDQLTNFISRDMQKFFGQLPVLKTEIERWQKQHQTVVIMVNDQDRISKVNDTLHDFEIKASLDKVSNLTQGAVQVVPATLQNGFELSAAGLVVVTENEMFAKVTKKRPRRQTLANAERLRSYTELKPGDYVVHINHGIGRFEGMQTLEVDGVHQDYITIDYQDNAKIFIPVTQLNLIQKYVSSEDKKPRVNKLGGTEWAKTKRKVASKIEDIADELVDLYAARAAQKGHAFPPDDAYQAEFEAAFPYVETPDQLRSIDEIKHDMEQPKPMDRLLVGDVGFGKTEVALRAAFKAIEDRKQVAFLVPTTILAQQHYDTMTARFDGFPVKIGILSRFDTPKQMKATLAGVASGEIDIVVGTHRLLSKDVIFKDLGLLLVDEEQRFGVKHKERIKQMRASVDVLTLTATPIPRTLNMSMIGVRDLSVIETPPANRYPIQTYVMEANPVAVQDGINRELARGGQVFYLHNRIDDIERVVDNVKQLVPDARVAYIHGRMTETQLESVLYDFIRGEYDVLVTTTIIETGVDIPNVNTMFIENADHMGLSQLYQLRGRIGRSNRVAYAYFTYQPNKVLTEESEKRLEAIRDFTELGSGFKIAMRDLSIRGAGNLLGQQQHGFIDSVGYDLYTQMLSQAVAKKRGQSVQVRSDTEIELGIEAYLPSEYIADERQKIEIYKRIRELDNEAQYVEVDEDLIDRFGDYPQAVANLLAVGHLKMTADAALISKIARTDDVILVTLSAEGSRILSGEAIFKALSETKLRATVSDNAGQLVVKLVIQPKMTETQWLASLSAFVTALAETVGVQTETRTAETASTNAAD